MRVHTPSFLSYTGDKIYLFKRVKPLHRPQQTMTTREDVVLGAITKGGIETLELEWRLGRHGARGFQAGISEDAWTKLWNELNASGKPCVDSKVTERVISGTKLVTTRDAAWWKQKTKLFDFEDPPYVRVSGSAETMEQIPPGAPLPPVTAGGFSRYKERRSYQHHCWSIDLTKVSSTTDIDCDKWTFEVEIELVNKEELFTRPVENILEWGNQVALDMLQLAGIV